MAFNPTVIQKGLNAAFAKAMVVFLSKIKDAPGLLKAALEIPSKAAYESLAWIGSLPAVQQWVGEINAKEFDSYDYSVKNLDWATASPVNENDVEDDQVGLIKMIPRMLVAKIMKHPVKLLINLLINGDSDVAFDGVAFFSDASGVRTIDNLLAGTGTSLAQLETDLNAALVAQAKFADSNGEPLDIKGNMIVCPMALENSFKKLVDSKSSPTATAGVDTYNPFAGRFEVIADPRLDADDANDWYLLATNEEVKPFIFQRRQAAKNRFWNKPGTKTWIYSADYRGNGAYGLPHLAVKTVNG